MPCIRPCIFADRYGGRFSTFSVQDCFVHDQKSGFFRRPRQTQITKARKNAQRLSLSLVCFAFSFVNAEPQVFRLASAGEAPYRPANDLGGSTTLPQAGIGLAYPWWKLELGWRVL